MTSPPTSTWQSSGSCTALSDWLTVERLYVLSLGSQQANRHVHWHLAPLPPGVPYEQQQTAVFDPARGHLDVPDDELADLARRLGERMTDSSTM
ncbi:hypothetical protein AB0E55_16085 [Amycolatopsis keratiniphila]|uniref:hypothetical protein n=1 Tax=Amycolatopsis keratiniphila TaxID=129921 RepID=UPI0033D3C2DE